MRSGAYRAVDWNPRKVRYDLAALVGVVLYLAVYGGVSMQTRGDFSPGVVALRALGGCALLLLHVVLASGPLARLDSRFLPLLYARRHLGVLTFLLAAGHGIGSAVLYHYGSEMGIFASLLLSNPHYGYLRDFPFEILGMLALTAITVLAVTSHDFWLQAFTPTTWKRLHMVVYGAYVLIVGHVLFGSLQADKNPVLVLLLGAGFGVLVSLHVATGYLATRVDRRAAEKQVFGYIDVCAAGAIPEGEARAFALAGERVAVVRTGDHISVVSNVCEHQSGPLGEGVVEDGCLVCPWHGRRYRPEDGTVPGAEGGVPTFHVRISQGRVMVDPIPNPPGTRVEPVRVPEPLRTLPS